MQHNSTIIENICKFYTYTQRESLFGREREAYLYKCTDIIHTKKIIQNLYIYMCVYIYNFAIFSVTIKN